MTVIVVDPDAAQAAAQVARAHQLADLLSLPNFLSKTEDSLHGKEASFNFNRADGQLSKAD